MPASDRQRWNEKYARGEHASTDPAAALVELEPLLPKTGRAIDIAGGAGRNAIWLARLGLDVTLADVSPVGLELARQRAAAAGVSLRTLELDLECDPFPAGPWDLIVSVHFLWRPLYDEFPRQLAPGGTLVIIQPTRSNLLRNDRPPAPYLLGDGELPRLVDHLSVVHYHEGWNSEGRHEAVLAARHQTSKPPQ